MKEITCDCGTRFSRRTTYSSVTIMVDKKIRTWECPGCGQEWYEKVKEPKEIPHD